MNKIKTLIKSKNSGRIIRGMLGITMLGIYYFSKEQVFIAFAMILFVQALFNITCPGGNCSTKD